jgi:hypothetical protein
MSLDTLLAFTYLLAPCISRNKLVDETAAFFLFMIQEVIGKTQGNEKQGKGIREIIIISPMTSTSIPPQISSSLPKTQEPRTLSPQKLKSSKKNKKNSNNLQVAPLNLRKYKDVFPRKSPKASEKSTRLQSTHSSSPRSSTCTCK